MSYLDRLVEQSGLRPAGHPVGAVVPRPSEHGPVGPATSDGGDEVDVVVETVVPARGPVDLSRAGPQPAVVLAPPVPSVPRSVPPDGVRAADRAPRPGQGSPETEGAPGRVPDSGDTGARPTADRSAPPPPAAPAVPDPVPDQAVTRTETLLHVIDWLAADPAAATGPAPVPDVTARPDGSAAGAPAGAGLAERPVEPAPRRAPSSLREVRREEPAPPAPRTDTPVEVRIDAVNLTLVSPAPAAPAAEVVPVPGPLASAPRTPRASAPPRTTTTDRLRRRYLRV